MLGIYGQEDTRPKPDEAKQFAAALKVNKIDHNVTIYEGVGHGFITPESYKDKPRSPPNNKNGMESNRGLLRRAFEKSNGVAGARCQHVRILRPNRTRFHYTFLFIIDFHAP